MPKSRRSSCRSHRRGWLEPVSEAGEQHRRGTGWWPPTRSVIPSAAPSGRTAPIACTRRPCRRAGAAAASKKCTPCSTRMPPLMASIPEPVAGRRGPRRWRRSRTRTAAAGRAVASARSLPSSPQQRVVAQHVVDDQDAARGDYGLLRDRRRLGRIGGQRLLAADVPARAQGGDGHRGVAAGVAW